MSRLIAGGTDENGVHYRVTGVGTIRALERREVDSLGDPRWVSAGIVDLASSASSTANTRALLHIIDDLAERIEGYRKSLLGNV